MTLAKIQVPTTQTFGLPCDSNQSSLPVNLINATVTTHQRPIFLHFDEDPIRFQETRAKLWKRSPISQG